jgi:hypothetical protein
MHHGFLKSFNACDIKYGFADEPNFTTCIKAAGVDYRDSLAQWEAFKNFILYRAKQGMTHK